MAEKTISYPIYKVSDLPLAAKPHEAIVDGLFWDGTFNLIQGPSKSGKSMLAYQLAWCLQNGHEFLGRKVLKRNCLYIDWELLNDKIQERFDKISSFFGVNTAATDNYMVYPLARSTVDLQSVLTQVSEFLKDNTDI